LVKNILIGALLIVTAGCSSLGKYLPSDFDNVEYGKLVELNVIANMPQDDWCKKINNQPNELQSFIFTYIC